MTRADTLVAVNEERSGALLAVESEMGRLVRAIRSTLLQNALRFSSEVQPSGYSVLRYIVANNPTPPGAIIAHVGMDKSAVSRQLRVLKDLGFVTSAPAPDDRRASLYSPTPLALSRLDEVHREIKAAYADVLDDWSDTDVSEFVRLLGAFNDRMERR